jgi:hypothetical protein
MQRYVLSLKLPSGAASVIKKVLIQSGPGYFLTSLVDMCADVFRRLKQLECARIRKYSKLDW